MPIDHTIALGVRPMQLESPVQQFGNALAIQGGMQKNALAQMQMKQLERAQADEEADRQAIIEAGGDLEKARNNLLARGRVKPAMEIGKGITDQRNTQSQIDEREAKTSLQHLGVLSGVLAPIAVKQDVTLDDVANILTTARAAGVPETIIKNIAGAVPKNAMMLPAFVKNLAMMTENGRKSLQMVLPTVSMTDTGGVITPTNTNPLAGPVGPLAGASPLTKSLTPGEVQTGEHQRTTFAETQRHNRTTEGLTARGQSMADARARDLAAATRDAGGRPPAGYRFKADGSLEAIPGGPAEKDKALTESQGKASGFTLRATEANKILGELEKGGTRDTGIIRSIASGTAGALPFVGNKLAEGVHAGMNVLPGVLGGPSSAQQQTDQARRDFVNAILRQESGAVIADSEFANASKQYFPQPGDSKETVEQKRRNRATAIRALETQAGPGVKKPANDPSKMSDAEIKAALGLR